MALEGKLTDMPLLDLLRVFQRGTRTGRLSLRRAEEGAVLWFEAGQVIHAVVFRSGERSPRQLGEAAIYQICDWEEGSFAFVGAAPGAPAQVTITRPTTAVIAAAASLRAAMPDRQLPPELAPDTPLRTLVAPAEVGEHVQLNPQQWLILSKVGRRATAVQIAAQTGLDQTRVLMQVAYLIELGLVGCTPLADLPERRVVIAPPSPIAGRPSNTPTAPKLLSAIRRRLQQLNVAAS